MKKIRAWAAVCWRSGILYLLFPAYLHAAPDCDVPAARLVSAEGNVEIKHESFRDWQPIAQGDAVCAGDFIRTGPYSRSGILIDGSDTLIRLDQNTSFQLVAPDRKPNSLIEVISGALHFISRIRHNLEVRTPFVNAAVDGTEFLVQVDAEETTLVLYEGDVLASNAAGSQRILPGQAVTAGKGQAPRFSTVIRPRDAVQWTLHYQPLLFGVPSDGHPYTPTFRAVVLALRQRDTAGAFGALKHVPPPGRDARFYSFRAGLFLLQGRVDEARRDLQQSLEKVQGNSAALALQAMIAVAQNRKEQALELSTQAVAADTNSAVALIALSYAQQACFDLEGALATIEQAVGVDPRNPYAHARLAELLLSTGNPKAAIPAAQEAVRLDARVAMGQTMLGFAHLTQVELDRARSAFQQAASLDQSDPMPRLGLGLALIRRGQLEQGRRELEVATLLDPQNALVRSYMGKAYYEERRDKVAASQYELAKQLDPNDPTPWFYEAILKQQQGRPVEALHSLQTSKALNDNRGVYRSRLLLDGDEAARSASLGQVYRDLNFERLALLQGWESLEADPSDHAGHRLLADSYVQIQQHELARVSELLQAQLLQPVNATPIQPLMAETALYVPDGIGPSDPGLNEYASLFHRDGTRLQLSALVGNDDQGGEEVILSGVKGEISYSLGQYHYETEGWRDNNDFEQDSYNVFVQGNLSADTRLQLEGRRSRKRYGNLLLGFDPDDRGIDSNWENEDVVRLGLYHRFHPGSELIGSLIHDDRKGHGSSFRSDNMAMQTDGWYDDRSWGGELRQLFDWGRVRATAGLGYLDTNSTIDLLVTMEVPMPPFFIPTRIPLVQSELPERMHQANAYIYSWFDLGQDVTLTLGLDYEDYHGEYENRQVWNPKFGLTWRLTPDTTLRGAVFRTFQRSFVASQTVEPTQVAGFNQFFDGINGERDWRHGLALDHRFSSDLFAGVELSRRERRSPAFVFPGPVREEDVSHKELDRAYVYWTPSNRTALAAEYIRERSHAAWNITTTQRIPLSLAYYHPSGLGGSLRPTYVRQYGEFTVGQGNETQKFWNLDLSVDFRLPKRRAQLSLEVRNLLDEEFGYLDTDLMHPLFLGGRTAALRVSVNY